MSEQWHVGQRVVLAIRMEYGPDRGKDRFVYATIIKIGRRWATYKPEGYGIREGRFDMETSQIDGGGWSSPGVAWPSLDAYDAHQALKAEWAALRSAVGSYSPPPKGLDATTVRSWVDMIRNAAERD